MVRCAPKRVTAGATGLALIATAAVGLIAASAPAAFAQTYPERPITLIVPFPPGGSTDVVARVLGERMGQILGQPVVIENRAGASGTIGIAHVATSQPDGYTLGTSGVGPTVLLHALGQDIGYVPQQDLALIGLMGKLSLVIATRSDLEQRTLAEVFDHARANPGELTYGTAGTATPGHLAMELLNNLAGVEILHVPYTGGTPAMNDILGGHIDLIMLPIPGIVEQIRAGDIHAVAVTGDVRSDLLPDVPTVAEQGFDGYSAELFNILVAPAGVSDEVVTRLSEALNAAQQDPGVLEVFAQQALTVDLLSPGDTTQYIADEASKWSEVIELLDLVIE